MLDVVEVSCPEEEVVEESMVEDIPESPDLAEDTPDHPVTDTDVVDSAVVTVDVITVTGGRPVDWRGHIAGPVTISITYHNSPIFDEYQTQSA